MRGARSRTSASRRAVESAGSGTARDAIGTGISVGAEDVDEHASRRRATSASSAASCGVWLWPPASGTNSSAAGTWAARWPASWPAPEYVRDGREAAALGRGERAVGEARGRARSGRRRAGAAGSTRHAAALGDVGARVVERRLDGGDRVGVDAADLERRADARRDHADRAGLDRRARPTVATVAGRAARRVARRGLEREDDLGGGGERVVAVGHRDLAGVPGLARRPSARGGAARRSARRRRGGRRGRAARGGARCGPRRARAIRPSGGGPSRRGRSSRAARNSARAAAAVTPAASRRSSSAASASVPTMQPRADRPRRRTAAPPRRRRSSTPTRPGSAMRRLEREHGAERAVVAAAVRDGVDVRPGGDDRAVAGRQRPQVPVRSRARRAGPPRAPTPRRGACRGLGRRSTPGGPRRRRGRRDRPQIARGARRSARRRSRRRARQSVPMEWYFRDMPRRGQAICR